MILFHAFWLEFWLETAGILAGNSGNRSFFMVDSSAAFEIRDVQNVAEKAPG